MNLLSLLLPGFLMLGTWLPGQARLFSHPGEKPGDDFGRSLAFLGDVDEDGVSDLLIGARGSVQVRSGSHGALLLRLVGGSPREDFGFAVLGPGDLDRDGRADFLVSSPTGGSLTQGKVAAYSGRTGKLLYAVFGDQKGDLFGSALAGFGDLDGDGTPEFGVGAPMHDNVAIDAGMIRIYSGKSGKPLLYFTGVQGSGGFGTSLAAVGDLDADGVDDILVGAGPGGYARIYSTKKASLLRMIPGAKASGFGTMVFRSEDLNRDKIEDYWISAPDESLTGKGKGVLRLFSGKDGKVLRVLSGPKALQRQKMLTAPSGASAFGWSLSDAGDLDGDDHDDYLIGDPFASGTLANTGKVELYSGKTHTVIQTWTGTAAGDLLGSRILGGVDFDGDGVPDVLISSFNTGKVMLYSGKTRQLLRSFQGVAKNGFGSQLRAHPDVDSDNLPDLLVASPFFDAFRGKIELFSSSSRKLLRTWKGANKGDGFGSSLALLPDRDKDGLPELLVGSPSHASGLGRVQILSSKSGASLLDIKGSVMGDRFAEHVASPGDLDGDGTSDLLLTAPGAASGAGEVQAWSGRTGKLLYKVAGSIPGGLLGSSLALLGDLDGDGLEDFMVGAPTSSSTTKVGPGSFSVHSGVDGRVLIQERSQVAGQGLGSAVAKLGDLDGDGRPEIAVSAQGGKGSVALYHAENPDAAFGNALEILPDQDADGFPEILIGLPGQGRVHMHSGKTGALLSALAPRDRGFGFGRCLGVADVNLDGAPDLAVGGAREGVDIYSLKTPALIATPNSWLVQNGGLQTWAIAAGQKHAGKIYMVLGSLSGVSPGIRFGSLRVPLNPDVYTSFSLSYPNQAPFLMSRGFLDLSGKAKAGLQLPPMDSSLKGLVFHHAFLVLGFSFQFEFASNPVPLLLR